MDKDKFEFRLDSHNSSIKNIADLDGVYELLLGKRPIIGDICIANISQGFCPLFIVESWPKERLDLNLRKLLKQEEIDFDLFYYNCPNYIFDITQLVVTHKYENHISNCYIVYVEGSTFRLSWDRVFYGIHNTLFVDCSFLLVGDDSYKFMRLVRKLFKVEIEPWKRKIGNC